MKFASFKNARVVSSTWLDEGGRRLDCNPYMSGAQEARDALKRLGVNKQPLNTLTVGYSGGIFNGPVFSRIWVDDPQYGVPFVGSSDISSADLSNLPLLKKSYAQSKKLAHLELTEGMTLITCSGTIGRMAYVRPDMAGLWSSQHVMKVVPDPKRIPPGYLFAFLSSRFGVPLVISGTYGAIIQHIEPQHVAGLDVPRFDAEIEQRIHSKIALAAVLRSRSAQSLLAISKYFDGLFPDFDLQRKPSLSVSSVSSEQLHTRMDAEYHNPRATEIRKKLAAASHKSIEDWCDDIFLPGIFKRIHVDGPEFAAPYFTGYSLYWNEPEPKGFLSKVTKLFDQVSLKEGMILIQAFGQAGGLTGRPVWVGRHLDKATTTHMLVRLIVKNRDKAAYLYGFLNSLLAYRQISCLPYGGSIPHFDVAGIKTVLVPCLALEKETEIAAKVLAAVADRDEALQLELDARKIVESLIQGAQ
jgi:type I restriction enzyme S subunit